MTAHEQSGSFGKTVIRRGGKAQEQPSELRGMAIAGTLSEADIAAGLKSCEVKDTFNCKTFFDKDKDGFIGRNELKTFLKALNSGARDLTDEETEAFLKKGDTNGDGKIDFDGDGGSLLLWQIPASTT
ncbi:parvalbumin beta 3-like [Hemicordylus capensis]|uniref:parvalbumin beta 3-like n=1 Tax=Hemicordylus capensis TaxID=884348 RepID=UPI0023032975|nr:parvalbumin beta 3-like [Hemicordylus capensis]